MHNRLIFRYHQVRAHGGPRLLRGCHLPPSGEGDEPTHWGEPSNEGTQEGRSSQALVVLG
jgi:hypothetical protein